MKILSSDTISYGEWLCTILQTHKIKPIKFADICDVDRSTVHHWINNTRFPDDYRVKHLAKCLAKITGIEVKELEKLILWKRYITKTGAADAKNI